MAFANDGAMFHRRLVYKDVGSRPGLFCPAPSGPAASNHLRCAGFEPIAADWTYLDLTL